MKFYLGILLGAVVVFFWGFLMWPVLSPRVGILEPIPEAESVVQAIREANVQTGVYVYPFEAELANLTGDAKKAAEEAFDAKMKKGPIVRLFVETQGRPAMDAKMMYAGFMHMLLAAAILATLTRSVLSWADFKARYAFIVAVAVFAAVWIDFSNAIWMSAPWNHQLYVAGYDIGAWILGGVPIAWGTRGDMAK